MSPKCRILRGHGLLLMTVLCMAILVQEITLTSASSEESQSSNESHDGSPFVIGPDQINFPEITEEGDIIADDDNEFDSNDNSKNKSHQPKDHMRYSDELASDEYDDMLNGDFESDGLSEQDHEWDLLMFTQQWPVTTCYHWREEDRKHACTLPLKKEFWTIHGVWPTKLGHLGPNFCNKTANFNLNQLQTIMDRLKEFWPDIDGETQAHDWLWKHEWLKHGTCAALLDALDNELKYFGQGLNWREAFSMTRILGDSNIHPDSNNTVIALHSALVKGLGGKNPSIHCLYDNKNDVSYLAEIRICFNKSLELTDCNGVKRGDAVHINYPGGTVITNCHISKPVHYPSLVPPVQRQQKSDSFKFPVVNMYKLLQFIMWFTL